MANDSITTVLSMVAWGTKLTFGLYDFSANVSSANGDVNRLAREVNLLAQVLRQIGSRLKEDGSLASSSAFNTVRQVLDQCQGIFNEIEALIPIGVLQDAQYQGSTLSVNMAVIVQLREQMEWSVLAQARVQYLLAHLDSLKLTLSVMLQTLYTAKATVWARQSDSPPAFDTLTVERLQVESLLIEQQLAIIRTYRRHEDFRRLIANASPAVTQSAQAQELMRRTQSGPTPSALLQYQEPTLSKLPFSRDENEDLQRVRIYSSSFVDTLLCDWTKLATLEDRLYDAQKRPSDTSVQQQYDEPWNHRIPSHDYNMYNDANANTNVNSDSRAHPESHASPNDTRVPPNLRVTTHSQVEMTGSSPRTSSANLQLPYGPFTPQPSTIWGPSSGGYFSPNHADPRALQPSAGPSPRVSPRSSFAVAVAGDGGPRSSSSSLKAEPVPDTAPSRRQPTPWRIRINQWYWDHLDEDLVEQNVKHTPSAALRTCAKDTCPTTDVFREHVSQDAISERGHEYTRVKRERLVNGRTQLDDCFCIDGILEYREICKLVELTERMRNGDWIRERDRDRDRHRERDIDSAPRPPRRSNGTAPPPPLDRSRTTPAPTKRRDNHRSTPAQASSDEEPSYGISPRTPTSTSTSVPRIPICRASTASEKPIRDPRRHDSRSDIRDVRDPRELRDPRDPRDFREAHAVSGSDRHERTRRPYHADEEGGRSTKEDSRRKSSRGKADTLTKLAAGAGLATLLDGLPDILDELPEMLSHL